MKILYSVKVREKKEIRYIYFRSYSLKHLTICLEWDYLDFQIIQVKRLKRIYRKNIKVIEV